MRSSRLSSLAAVVVPLALLVPFVGCGEPFALDPSRLDAEGAAAVAAFAEVALPLPDGISFRLADPAALEAALLREFTREARVGDLSAAEVEARARQASVRTPIRYDATTNEVLVVGDNLRRASLEATGVDLADEGLFGGMLLHECGRAYAEGRFGMVARIEACASVEEVSALGLLTAGIAQFAARKAARAGEREGALERATALLGGANPQVGRMLAFAESIVVERFEAGGEAAVEALLDAPVEAIRERAGPPTGEASAGGAPAPDPLDALVDRYAAARSDRRVARHDVPAAKEREAFQFLAPDAVDRIVAGIEADRAVTVVAEEEGAGPREGAYFRRHRSADEARFLVDTVRGVFDAQEGTRVEPREGAGWSGFLVLPASLVSPRAESAFVRAGRRTFLLFRQEGMDVAALLDELDALAAAAGE